MREPGKCSPHMLVLAEANQVSKQCAAASADHCLTRLILNDAQGLKNARRIDILSHGSAVAKAVWIAELGHHLACSELGRLRGYCGLPLQGRVDSAGRNLAIGAGSLDDSNE